MALLADSKNKASDSSMGMTDGPRLPTSTAQELNRQTDCGSGDLPVLLPMRDEHRGCASLWNVLGVLREESCTDRHTAAYGFPA